tara:strand:+ start:243 stop:740 length:498 start_codon:yes stop_codon:yes gene_type:complete
MYIERSKTFKKHFKEIVKVKFKKMTQKQRDYGKIIAVVTMTLIVLIGMLSSCTVYKTPQVHITSVLAVTAQGDTLKLPIDAIRPIYNYNTYPSNRYPIIHNYPFYYSPNRYQPIYGQRPNNNNNNINIPNMPSSSGSGPNISSPVIVNPPSNPPNPAKTNSKRNN